MGISHWATNKRFQAFRAFTVLFSQVYICQMCSCFISRLRNVLINSVRSFPISFVTTEPEHYLGLFSLHFQLCVECDQIYPIKERLPHYTFVLFSVFANSNRNNSGYDSAKEMGRMTHTTHTQKEEENEGQESNQIMCFCVCLVEWKETRSKNQW